MRKKVHPFPFPKPLGFICNDHVTKRNSARACLVLTDLILLGEPNCVQKSWPGLARNVTLPGQKGEPILMETVRGVSKETYKKWLAHGVSGTCYGVGVNLPKMFTIIY